MFTIQCSVDSIDLQMSTERPLINHYKRQDDQAVEGELPTGIVLDVFGCALAGVRGGRSRGADRYFVTTKVQGRRVGRDATPTAEAVVSLRNTFDLKGCRCSGHSI